MNNEAFNRIVQSTAVFVNPNNNGINDFLVKIGLYDDASTDFLSTINSSISFFATVENFDAWTQSNSEIQQEILDSSSEDLSFYEKGFRLTDRNKADDTVHQFAVFGVGTVSKERGVLEERLTVDTKQPTSNFQNLQFRFLSAATCALTTLIQYQMNYGFEEDLSTWTSANADVQEQQLTGLMVSFYSTLNSLSIGNQNIYFSVQTNINNPFLSFFNTSQNQIDNEDKSFLLSAYFGEGIDEGFKALSANLTLFASNNESLESLNVGEENYRISYTAIDHRATLNPVTLDLCLGLKLGILSLLLIVTALVVFIEKGKLERFSYCGNDA